MSALLLDALLHYHAHLCQEGRADEATRCLDAIRATRKLGSLARNVLSLCRAGVGFNPEAIAAAESLV